ncbi:ATP-binding protein [Chitinophaga pinensis]|uniref:Biotin carboxylase n=1 Tax=Chitinophaga pinensis (strain ATCC 43595 / DSM 2588 / LMG 13176 / NBRC 15968 / NCIMB 11800 / UQM 2034) TaxID=485918 RepID=A0A979G281_CHIPD|nr:ATP-binding protein [Chitinophaga pinensis]ACU59562.1 conserved hypothetical protein [Chitinophaga pinensis DSM 2588]
MIEHVKPKEATAIINSLLGGVVPKIGLQHITVGRSAEVASFLTALEDVKNGHSMMKFWIGDYGSGKSFMMHLLNTVAMKQKFVVANADFTPENRLYSTENRATLLYTAIIDSLAIQSMPEGGALPTLLEKWIEQIMSETAEELDIDVNDVREEKYVKQLRANMERKLNEVTDIGSFEFNKVIVKYFEAYLREDDELRICALRWLKGEYRNKTHARMELGAREIIDDGNYYNMLKNFCRLFVSMGYNGFIINLDEAINLYKITMSHNREKNYEKLLSMYNDCFQGKVSHLFFNIAGTREFLENERRGLFSYHALKSRLETNKHETNGIRDFAQPVIRLLPLDNTEVFVLLQSLRQIFELNYNTTINIDKEDIRQFMEDIYNKPGAHEFLTPREVIRDFLNVLSIMRQNPDLDKRAFIKKIKIRDERPHDNIKEI